MPQVHGHHHLAIQVKDLPAAERFYVDALGLRVLRRWPWEDGRPGERSVWLSVGAGEEFLALEVHRVHHPVVDVLVGTECAGLPEHGVDQRGLAMVHVGHDGHIAQILARRHAKPFGLGA